MAADEGRKRPRGTPKGRQLDDEAWREVQSLLGARPRRRDLLIEFLHLIQDEYGHLAARHLRALAEELRMSQAEVWEVATFYAHFDPVKEDETPPPALTIRVCDSLSCELAGARELMAALQAGTDPAEVRVVRAPCMGRCDTAPVAELRHAHVDRATAESVLAAVEGGLHGPVVPDYEPFEAYTAGGGYATLAELRRGGDPETVQAKVLESGLRGTCRVGALRSRLAC
jgi:formate dehydrogenase